MTSTTVQVAGISRAPLLSRLHDWRLRRANVEFAVLGLIATGIAFHAAILLNLNTPGTAAITVWVVANTRPGHVLSKSIYRVLGTVLGAAAAIGIVAALDAVPILLFTALALWIAVCTGIGNLLRHFRSYFGLLAGYTAAFIVLGAYENPGLVLNVALDRTSAILIGVLSMSLVVSILGTRRSPGDMERALGRIHRQCLEAIRCRWDMSPDEISVSRLALSRTYVETEALLEYANLESPGFHLHTRQLRALTGLLLDVLDASGLAARQLDGSAAPGDLRKEIRAIFMEIDEALEPAVICQDARSLGQVRRALEQIGAMIGSSGELAETSLERELLYPIGSLLEKWAPLLDPVALEKIPLRDPLRPDFRGAGRHALRTFAGLSAAMAFWNFTSWQEGPMFLINGAAFCALSSTMSHPAKALVMFSKSTAVAAVAGFFCKFFLMPHASGYWGLMLCLAAVLLPVGCLAFSRRPTLDLIGMTGGLFMLALIQPTNHMTYDPGRYLSFAIAAVFAGLFLSVVFSLILPTRPEKEAAAVLRTFHRSIRGLIDWPPVPSFHTWRQTAHRHLRNLQLKKQLDPPHLAEGLRLLDYGSCLLRLRGLMMEVAKDRRLMLERVLLAGRQGDGNTAAAGEAARRALEELRQTPEIEPRQRFTLIATLSEFLALLPVSSSHPQPS